MIHICMRITLINIETRIREKRLNFTYKISHSNCFILKGKKADEVSSSAKHPDILEKLEKLERLIVAASHTTNKQR